MNKRIKWFVLFVLIFALPCFAQEQKLETFPHAYFPFDGQWIPDVDSSLIGPKNYRTLQNLRPVDGGLEGVRGYSEVNTRSSNTTYYKPRSGFHFEKAYPEEDHVILQFFNYNESESRLYQNITGVPDDGNFEETALHEDETYSSEVVSQTGQHLAFVTDDGVATPLSGLTPFFVSQLSASAPTSGLTPFFTASISINAISEWTTFYARFAEAPQNHIVYSNGAASHIWGGDETHIQAFLTCTSDVSTWATDARDYTFEVYNTEDDNDNSVLLNPDGATSAYWLVGSTRPLQGVTYYVTTANATSSKIQGSYWSGATWTNLNIFDPVGGFAETGESGITFASTVDTAKPWYLEGRLLYWYQFQVAGNARIYHVSVDAPWQKIKDIWDGVPRACVSFQKFEGEDGGFKDYTLDVQETSSHLYPIGAKLGGLKSNEHVILQFEDRTQGMLFNVLTGNTNVSGSSVYYWTGADWSSVTTYYDGTRATGVTSVFETGPITWDTPDKDKEFKYTKLGLDGYAYKIVWDDTLGGTGADEDAVIVDTIYGIPAPLKLPTFKFPVFYRDRVLNCGYLKGNEPNRCDFCAPNAPDVWNGLASSDDGRQSLYFGSGGELTTGIQLYNRYGSNIFTSLVMFERDKTYIMVGNSTDLDSSDRFKIHTIAENVGCPAALTVTILEVGYEMVSEELLRNVVAWLSSQGPMTFDGAVMQPIKGLENYFDQASNDYVGASAIASAFAWYDANHREWNLRVGDYWFAYNFIQRKWFEKNTGTAEMPQVAFQVTDTYGSKYVYGGIDTGTLVHLEDGSTWDGTAITQVVETGDFHPSGDAWHDTYLRRVKLAYKVIEEDATLQATHYVDRENTGTSAFPANLSNGTTGSIVRITKPIAGDRTGWLHRLRFEVDTSGTTKGFQPMGFGYQFQVVREDDR